MISPAAERTFTCKALLAGLVGALAISILASYNFDRLRQPAFIGSHFPVAPVCYVLLLGVGWNLTIGRLWRAAAFSPRELVVVLGCSFVACGFAFMGLFRTLHTSLILPWFHASSRPTWTEFGILQRLPPELFPLAGKSDGVVYGGFVQGLGSGRGLLSPAELPWAAWLGPAAHWGPLFLCFGIAMLGLALVVHRQWSHHEQLAYPLSSVLTSLIQRREGRLVADLFHSKLFWLGFTPVLGVHLYNLIEIWVPDLWPEIQRTYFLNWDALYRILPSTKSTGLFAIHEIKLYLFIVGIAYFLPSAIGFSLGISQFLLLFISTQVYFSTGTGISFGQLELQRAGAFLGYALVLGFTGRIYYWNVLCAALGARRDVPPEGRWAARLCLAGTSGFFLLLVQFGLDWVIALIFTSLLFTLFLVVSRIIAETGIPIVQATWTPASFMLQALGPVAVGATPLVFIHWLSTIMVSDTREALLPFITTAVKTADDAGVRLQRLSLVLLAAIVLALAVGFSARLWSLYNFGAAQDDRLFNITTVQGLDRAAVAISEMSNQATLAASDAASGLGKLPLFSFAGANAHWIFYGAFAAILLALLRLRFLGWPLHPVMIMVWGAAPNDAFKNLSYCFLAGWAIKSAIVRFGGGRVYQDLKPLFLGLIIGDVVAAGLTLGTGFVYHFFTGLLPRFYSVLPNVSA